jgi:hypothetical protein
VVLQVDDVTAVSDVLDAHRHQLGGLHDALGPGADPPVLHVERDAQVLADDHAGVMTSTRQPRSASSSATDVAWWKPELVDDDDVARLG